MREHPANYDPDLDEPAERLRPELWLDVPGYAGLYEVSNHGRVKGQRVEYLEQVFDERGVRRVTLSQNGQPTNHAVHRLVLIAFCGFEPFPGAQGAHNDGNTANNHLTNLRWASAQENADDVERHGTRCKGVDVYGAVLDDESVRHIRRLCRAGFRNPELAERYGVSISTIHLIRHHKTWKHVA